MKRINSESSPSKLDRKTIEKNRRMHMKGLCFKLASLVPSHYCKTSVDMLSQQDRLDLAASYIKQLKGRIDELTKRKELTVTSNSPNSNHNSSGRGTDPSTNTGVKLPIVELREWNSGLQVSVITGVGKNFMLYKVISILHEEGAEVVSASLATIGDKIFHTLHAQVKILRLGIETTRVWQRLQQLAC